MYVYVVYANYGRKNRAMAIIFKLLFSVHVGRRVYYLNLCSTYMVISGYITHVWYVQNCTINLPLEDFSAQSESHARMSKPTNGRPTDHVRYSKNIIITTGAYYTFFIIRTTYFDFSDERCPCRCR